MMFIQIHGTGARQTNHRGKMILRNGSEKFCPFCHINGKDFHLDHVRMECLQVPSNGCFSEINRLKQTSKDLLVL